MKNVSHDLPDAAMEAAAFADSLAKKFESQGKNPADLFIALVDFRQVAKGDAECVVALGGRK